MIYCYHCQSGNHGDCTLDYCACPLAKCESSRFMGSWKRFTAHARLGEQDGRIIYARKSKDLRA